MLTRAEIPWCITPKPDSKVNGDTRRVAAAAQRDVES